MTDGMTVISNINTTHSDEFIFVPSILTDTPPSIDHSAILAQQTNQSDAQYTHIHCVPKKSTFLFFKMTFCISQRKVATVYR